MIFIIDYIHHLINESKIRSFAYDVYVTNLAREIKNLNTYAYTRRVPLPHKISRLLLLLLVVVVGWR